MIYRHFSNYRQIIGIEIKLPEIIGDLKELSISISKLPGKLSKNYRYQKNYLSLTPSHKGQKCSKSQKVGAAASGYKVAHYEFLLELI